MLTPAAAPRLTTPREPRRAEERRVRPKAAAQTNTKMIAQIVGGSVASLAVIFGIVWFATRGSTDSNQEASVGGGGPVRTQTPTAAGNPIAIPPELASQYFERNVVVEFTVRKTGRATTTTRFFLNSKGDLSAVDNFTVTFTGEVFDQLRARGMVDLDDYFLSKTVRVTGMVTKYGGRFQIQISDANQLQFVSKRS
jgi:hypothetical protein